MHSPAASTSALPAVENHDADKISAYYSLAFPNFTYYLQTLTVTIGRRPFPSATATEVSLVDVDLGPLKSVSRLHARIEYEEDEERFVLVVLGRNGAWVDGIWAGSGSKVPLGARSQIQIATRTFQFILPPPTAPEPTSLSPPPSTARQRSPSVDITSLSPGSSHPASPRTKVPNTPAPDNPTPAPSKPAKSLKKRKRTEPEQPLPENMPPKPPVTYAVMCYRAITSLSGKATLQDVVQWMIDNYEWYRLNVGGPWENSIRHNLSSNRAFRNVERSPEERGKGFIWGIDPKFEKGLQDQDAKARHAELALEQGHTGVVPPPPAPKLHPQPPKPVFTKEPLVKSLHPKEKNPARPAEASAQSSCAIVNGSASSHAHVLATAPATAPNMSCLSTPCGLSDPPGSSSSTPPGVPNPPQIPPNVSLPIVVAPLPDSHPAISASAGALASSPSAASAILTTPPIVLHAGTLVLNPSIFSHLTPEQLRELEGLGAQKALEILQSHIVRFLKARLRTEGGGRGRGRGRGRVRGGASSRGGKTTRKDDEPPESGIVVHGTEPVLSRVEQDQKTGRPAPDPPPEKKSPSTTLSFNSLRQSTQPNGTGTETDAEAPVAKKRKADSVISVDVDVVGT